MNKSHRHDQILKIIRERPVHTQQELARELKALGISATQVTLSRDIRELRLAKTSAGYRQITAEPLEAIREVRAAQNLVVVKTSPAHASSLAAALDRENWPEIVGTIAGDDTVLVVSPDSETAETVRGRLAAYLAPSA